MSSQSTFADKCREFAKMRNAEVSPWEEQNGKLFRQTINQNWIDSHEIMDCVISLNERLKAHGKTALQFKVVTQEWWEPKDGKPFHLCRARRFINIETTFLECLNGRIESEQSFFVLVKGILQTINEICA